MIEFYQACVSVGTGQMSDEWVYCDSANDASIIGHHVDSWGNEWGYLCPVLQDDVAFLKDIVQR